MNKIKDIDEAFKKWPEPSDPEGYIVMRGSVPVDAPPFIWIEESASIPERVWSNLQTEKSAAEHLAQISSPNGVSVTGLAPHLMVFVHGLQPMTAPEAEALCKEIQKAVREVRSGNRPKAKLGDLR